MPGLQLGEHTWEQFVPKYPSLQARGRHTNIYDHTEEQQKLYNTSQNHYNHKYII